MGLFCCVFLEFLLTPLGVYNFIIQSLVHLVYDLISVLKPLYVKTLINTASLGYHVFVVDKSAYEILEIPIVQIHVKVPK